jgi:hypothetical protein
VRFSLGPQCALPCCCPADPPTLAGPDVPADEARERNPRVALLYLGLISVFLLVSIGLHGLAIYLWKTSRWTRGKPMPDFLYFPTAELLLLNLLALPVSLFSFVLMLQSPAVALKALGAFVFFFVLAYLVLVAYLLGFVVLFKDKLGLRYVTSQVPDETSSGKGSKLANSASWASFASLGSVIKGRLGSSLIIRSASRTDTLDKAPGTSDAGATDDPELPEEGAAGTDSGELTEAGSGTMKRTGERGDGSSSENLSSGIKGSSRSGRGGSKRSSLKGAQSWHKSTRTVRRAIGVLASEHGTWDLPAAYSFSSAKSVSVKSTSGQAPEEQDASEAPAAAPPPREYPCSSGACCSCYDSRPSTSAGIIFMLAAVTTSRM